MPIINAGGIFIESVVALPDAPVNQAVPFQFEGKNNNDYAVVIMPKPACGCTSMEGTIMVAAGESFVIKGELSARKAPVAYSKTVTIHIAKDEPFRKYNYSMTLTFTGVIK